ncbi:MAG: hypothetical protein OER90_10790 [Gemmatimonadota bacterium]|nr:hypothetical protein [Gemmatimonadota bacterium]
MNIQKWGAVALAAVAAVAIWVAFRAYSGAPALDTRTFELQNLDADDARQIITPYVYHDRQDAPGSISHSDNAITVRETVDNLDKIARVLAEMDRPRPTVRLHFQLIEANGASTNDPAIAEVETELRKLFRYQGYRLLHEAVVGGTQGSHIEQVIGEEDASAGYILNASIGTVRGSADSGTVQLNVGVRNPMRGALHTTVNARVGQTLVVGNAELIQGGGTLILTVRPEFVVN